MGKQRTSVREVLTAFSALVLSAVLGLGFTLLVNKTHDFLARDNMQEQAVVGTWQGSWQDVPAVTVKIDREGDQLTGSVAFQAVVRTGAGSQLIGNPVTVPLKDVRFDGRTLHFKVDDLRAARTFRDSGMEITLTSAKEAELKVTRCPYGNEYDIVRLTKTA